MAAEPGKSAAVTAVGVLAVLLGGYQVASGGAGCLTVTLFGNHLMRVDRDAAGTLAVMAAAFLLTGGLGVAAGTGVLTRRRWGRDLAFPAAGFTALLGLWFLSRDARAGVAVFGWAHILYAASAAAVLAWKRGEFRRADPDPEDEPPGPTVPRARGSTPEAGPSRPTDPDDKGLCYLCGRRLGADEQGSRVCAACRA